MEFPHAIAIFYDVKGHNYSCKHVINNPLDRKSILAYISVTFGGEAW